MSAYLVTHSRKDGPDADRRIDAIGFDGYVYPLNTVINWIESGVHSFFVLVLGQRVTVLVRKTVFGHKYLTTSPDGFKPNNLLYLPDC
ncbi:uncharacterized protein DUF3892 [Novosphingobium kunmingense]|uniref:Uncharacterized protein DUF3892 n=1 Tax=Novosphingobium kunmingense TaxID=1211806 RepID=A0A2N0H305_9SPHN|nr:DUF3892 domain-containing protein [Novosphingobium kunmingense]PKB13299.1 uncharacterized protein DUF3892 [Novosphingobium kunmingense]